MGSLNHMVEDRKWERVGSWRWTAQCRSNRDGVTGGLLKLEPVKTIADLYCVLHRLQKERFGSAPSPKSRWCKRTRVLSKWSPADCWPLCLFPSIMLSCVAVWLCARTCVYWQWGTLVCVPLSAFGCARVSEGLWRICLCGCVTWMSNLACSYSAKHIQRRPRPRPRPCPWWQESRGSLNQLTLFWQWKMFMPRTYFFVFCRAVSLIDADLAKD